MSTLLNPVDTEESMFTVSWNVGQLPSPEPYVVEPSVAVTTLIIFFIMVLACAIPGKFSWFGHGTGSRIKKGVYSE